MQTMVFQRKLASKPRLRTASFTSLQTGSSELLQGSLRSAVLNHEQQGLPEARRVVSDYSDMPLTSSGLSLFGLRRVMGEASQARSLPGASIRMTSQLCSDSGLQCFGRGPRNCLICAWFLSALGPLLFLSTDNGFRNVHLHAGGYPGGRWAVYQVTKAAAAMCC